MSAIWTRLNSLLLVLVLLCLLALIAMVAMRAEGGPLDPPGAPGSTAGVRLPGTPIAGPTAINAPGHYYLTQSFSTPAGFNQHGIVINADDVSLDLGGFTITGSGTANAGMGIEVFLRNRVSISNGTLTNFQWGILTNGGAAHRIDAVRAIGNQRGFHIGSNETTVVNCEAKDNGETGILIAAGASYNSVTSCTASYNQGPGVTLEGNDNTVASSVVMNNDLSQNLSWGSILINGVRNIITQNTLNGYPIVLPANLINSLNTFTDNVCEGSVILDQSGKLQYYSVPDHLNANCPVTTQ